MSNKVRTKINYLFAKDLKKILIFPKMKNHNRPVDFLIFCVV